jgi:hypothetical protein
MIPQPASGIVTVPAELSELSNFLPYVKVTKYLYYLLFKKK